MHLLPGVHRLTHALELNHLDSGVQFFGDATISGGVPITGWSPLSGNADVLSAAAPPGAPGPPPLRGRRARARPRMAEADAAALFAGSNMTDAGFTLAAGVPPPRWPRGGLGVEFVYPQSTSPWTEPRCAVASANATHVTMKQPCWRNLVHKACGQGSKGPPAAARAAGLGAPTNGNGYIENVGGHLGVFAPGEWALDGTRVLYAPRTAAERVAALGGALDAVMPVVQTLVDIDGAADLSFTNISFSHATWLRPGEADGLVEQQTGCSAVGTNPNNSVCENDWAWSVKAPGNVAVRRSRRVSFVGCEFSRLGGVGVDLSNSSDCSIDGSYFHDVSGAAVQIGDFQYPLGAESDVGNSVTHTIVHLAAAEYSGFAGIRWATRSGRRSRTMTSRT